MKEWLIFENGTVLFAKKITPPNIAVASIHKEVRRRNSPY